MNDERDDLLAEIGRELSIDPSPAFKARVREGIEQPRASRAGAWRWVGIAAMAASVMVAVMMFREAQVPSGRPLAITDSAVGGHTSIPSVMPMPERRFAVVRPTKSGRGPANGAEAIPEVLVDPSQLEGLKQMVAEAEQRASAAVAPIVIEPITVVPIQVTTLFDPFQQGEHQ